jgi:hypothetical protein
MHDCRDPDTVAAFAGQLRQWKKEKPENNASIPSVFSLGITDRNFTARFTARWRKCSASFARLENVNAGACLCSAPDANWGVNKMPQCRHTITETPLLDPPRSPEPGRLQ